MRTRVHIPVAALFFCFAWAATAQQNGTDVPKPSALSTSSKPTEANETVKPQGEDAGPAGQVLDRVIAVVNNQVILASDLDRELRLFYLLPINDHRDSTPAKALERLTTRALIVQQILQEDPQGMEISPSELEASLAELRQSLPACKRRDCTTPAGWAAYLATLSLTTEDVSAYWSNRMAVLRFIEQRFRSGIRITAEEIQKYYRETLVPQYAKPEDAPSLDRVSQRIQEILLQQQVNALLNDWLKSLQDQGQVEVLDASLRTPRNAPTANPEPPASGPVIPGTPAVQQLSPNTLTTPVGPPRKGGTL